MLKKHTWFRQKLLPKKYSVFNFVATYLDFRSFFDIPSSIMACTFSEFINGKGGWCILANAPSGGTKIFWGYAWGLGVSFVYNCMASS